jgi:hypothetical protein
MKDKTFADYCMRHGVVFPADTVVINVQNYFTQAYGGTHRIEQRFGAFNGWDDGQKLRPIFESMFIELSPCQGIFLYTSSEVDIYSSYACMIWLPFGVTVGTKSTPLIFDWCLRWTWDKTYGDATYTFHWTDNPTNGEDGKWLPLFNRFVTSAVQAARKVGLEESWQWEDSPSFIEVICSYTMAAIHRHTECELITHNRGTRRTTKRKTGKEPSPYFLLKVEPGKPQKRYAGNSSKSQHHNKQHIVRGHFRHTMNHPIEHLNGTRWIPSHMRGNESLGQVQKGYRIVLPDNEGQPS